jgi:hypothetical protein
MPEKKPDAALAWKQMEDLVVPRLRITLPERAILYHLIRHSRLEGRRQLHFSMAWLSRGTRVSPGALRAAIRSLSAKGILRILERSKAGHFVEVRLPGEFRLARLDSPAASAAIPTAIWSPPAWSAIRKRASAPRTISFANSIASAA